MRSKIKAGAKNAAIRVFAVTEHSPAPGRAAEDLKQVRYKAKKQIICASFHPFQTKFVCRISLQAHNTTRRSKKQEAHKFPPKKLKIFLDKRRAAS